MAADDSETLLIDAVEAKNLNSPEGEPYLPYVHVSVGSKKKKSKVPKQKTPNPKFEDSKWKFQLPKDATEFSVEIFHHGKLKDERIGFLHIQLPSLQPYNTLHDKWFPLESPHEGEKPGEIHLRLYLFPKKPKNANKPSKDKAKNPLFRAVKNRDLLTIMTILENSKIDPNKPEKRQLETPLHRACNAWDNEHIIITLLNHPAVRVDVQNMDANTPLHTFCQKFRNPNCEEPFNLFMQKKADVNAKNKQGETPLHKAVFNPSIRIMLVEKLLENGAEVNASSPGGTALHYAVHLGRTDLVSLLIQGGADLKSTDSNGQTPIDLCKKFGYEAVLRKLTDFQALVEFIDGLPIPEYKDQLPEVKKILLKNGYFKWKLPELNEQALQKLDIQTTGLRLRLAQEFKSITDADPSKATVEAEEKKPTEAVSTESFKTELTSGSNHWLISEGEVEFTELLGQGAAGKVYKGLYKNQVVAIKVLKAGSNKELEEFKQEFDIISSVSSQFIVKLYGAILGDKAVGDKLCMVMEFCARGSLYDVLSKCVIQVGWTQVFHFATELLSGMHALHSHNPQILHRDLKSLNLLVTQEFHVRVCDFGLSRFDTGGNMKTLQRLRGTYAYAAPEIYFGTRYTAKSDVFSIGILLWECVYRCIFQKYQRPYAEFPDLKMDYQIIIKTAKQNLRPTLPPSTPPPVAALIRQCLMKDQDTRPSCEELLQQFQAFQEDYRGNKEQWDSTITAPIIGEVKF